MNKETKSNIGGILRYAKKTAGFEFHSPELKTKAINKSHSPNQAIRSVFIGMLCGKYSAAEFKKMADKIQQKINHQNGPCRSTLCGLLSEERSYESLRKQLHSQLELAKRLRIHNTIPGLGGLTIVGVDAIDMGQVHNGTKSCDLCLTRMIGGIPYHFHKLVVLSLFTTRGPVAFDFRFVLPADIKHLDLENISDEKFKSECELSATKALLKDVAERNNGKLPFDLLYADALFANAPFMEQIESYGIGGMFTFKQEKRKLYQEAKKDFSASGFGFNVLSESWSNEELKRVYSAKSSTYEDKNRKEENKSVKIFEITRQEEGEKPQTTMIISSNLDFITAKIVENSRFLQWSQHENGVFNNLTNRHKQAKHIPFHDLGAMLSIAALMLICLGIINLYKKGNLTRGGRKFIGTMINFFEQNFSSFSAMRLKKLLALFYHPPPNISL